MAEINDKHYKDHAADKKKVEKAFDYFKNNAMQFALSRKILYKSSLTDKDAQTFKETDKPTVQANVLEPITSRVISEFFEQIPDPSVSSNSLGIAAVINKQKSSLLAFQQQVVEQYLRYIFNHSMYAEQGLQAFTHAVTGGYGVFYVYTEYENYKSVKQIIKLKACDDPRLCYFDPLAKSKTKEDGEFAGEIIFKDLKEIEEEFPDADIQLIKNQKDIFAINQLKWVKKETEDQYIVAVANHFYKKYSYEMFYEISDPLNPKATHGIFKDAFDKWMDNWSEWLRTEVPPEINKAIDRPKIHRKEKRKICKIYRKQFVGDVLLQKPEETEFFSLPYIFVDGNSHEIDEEQFTRPFFYNAMDMQRVKNVNLSTLVAQLENMRQVDILIAAEALPYENQQYMQSWLNIQKSQTALIYQAYNKLGQANPPPTPFQRGELNPQLIALDEKLDMLIQRTLGSYDQQNNMQNGELSGIAITKGTINSNMAAKPYFTNYLIALTQLAQTIVEILPKYYKTMTTLPTMGIDGKRDYIVINNNQQENTDFDYDPTDLKVMVKAGASYAVQQKETLNTLIGAMDKYESFRAMMSPKGLPIFVDQFDIRGKETLKAMAEEFVEQSEKAAQMQGNKPNPLEQKMMLEEKKLQLEAQKIAADIQIKQTQLEIEKDNLAIKDIDLSNNAIIKAHETHVNNKKVDAENNRTEAELAMKFASEFAHHRREDSRHELEKLQHHKNPD